MKNSILPKKTVVCLVVAFFALPAFSQSLRTGYFLDGYQFRYRINPAFMNERGHVSIPIIGGVEFDTKGNTGFSQIFYDSPLGNDEHVLFMHESVNTADFLNGLSANNHANLNVDMTLLSTGFHGFGGFNSIDLSLRSGTSLNLPSELLRFMKVANPMLDALTSGNVHINQDGTISGFEELGKDKFTFGGLRMQTTNFIDLSLGHSRHIGESLTLGVRGKLLFGIGYADVEFDRMDIEYNNIESWNVKAHGNATAALGGEFKYEDKVLAGNTESEEVVVGYSDITPGMQGFGLGLDLGAVYEFKNSALDGLSLSASLNDLGFIKWSDASKAVIAGDEYSFKGFDRMSIITGTESLNSQLDDLGDDLADFFALREQESDGATTGLGAKLNLGAEYVMPFYKNMSVGVLYTHAFNDVDYLAYDMASVMLNVSPLKCLDLAVSGNFSDYGTGFGAIMNLSFTGFSFFLGTDWFLNDMSDYYVPNDDLNANVSMGINIALSRHKAEKNNTQIVE